MSSLNVVLVFFGVFVFIPLGIYSIVSPDGAWRLGWFGRNWWFADGPPSPSGSALTSIAVTGFLQVGIGIAMLIGGIAYRAPVNPPPVGNPTDANFNGTANITLSGALSATFSGPASCANGEMTFEVDSPPPDAGMPLMFEGGQVTRADVTLSRSGDGAEATVSITTSGSNGYLDDALYMYYGHGNLAKGLLTHAESAQSFVPTGVPPSLPADTVKISGGYTCQ